MSPQSALASKATGFPIAKIAARLAVGYTLDEIPNDITKATPASFEPVIDYVVTKIPRWAFEKLPGTTGILGTQMQSVGEAMAIGRTFPESLQKALRSLEQGRLGLNADPAECAARRPPPTPTCSRRVAVPTPERPFQIGELAAPRHHARGDPRRVPHRPVVPRPDAGDHRGAPRLEALAGPDDLEPRGWKRAKRLGFADAQLAYLWGIDESTVAAARQAAGVHPTYKTVDTCAAEFAAATPYHYSTWEDENEVARRRTGRASSSSARARTASARASSSTTAACTPASPCARPGSRR